MSVCGRSIDFDVFSKKLQSLNITLDGKRVMYVGNKGQEIADSEVNKSKIPESCAHLNSFTNAIKRESGSPIDMVDNTTMIATYQPLRAFHIIWAVLLMQQNNATINIQ